MPSAHPQYFALAGDIGGTHSRFALFPAPSNDKIATTEPSSHPLHEKNFLNSTYMEHHGAINGFSALLQDFLLECHDHLKIDMAIVACFACAGPVKNNACEFKTRRNLKFVIRGDDIVACEDGHLKDIKFVRVVNDFVGQGYGALDLHHATECVELLPGSTSRIDPHGVKACVGAGTGLGQCYLTPLLKSSHPSTTEEDHEHGDATCTDYECFASEGGQVDFNPRTDLELQLRDYFITQDRKDETRNHQPRSGVEVERVASGRGLADVYTFLRIQNPHLVNAKVQEAFVQEGEMAGKVVAENVDECELCRHAMEIFSSAFGSEVASTALRFLPSGGLYVTGGVTCKLLSNPGTKPFFVGNDAPFLKAFLDKGRLTKVVERIPLFAVLAEDLGVRGARLVATKDLQHYMKGLS